MAGSIIILPTSENAFLLRNSIFVTAIYVPCPPDTFDASIRSLEFALKTL
jgi:hypothetical protein